MSNTTENLKDIFSIFHDGGIDHWEKLENGIQLTIECPYLAELIHPDFVKFYVDLIGISKLELDPWMSPIHLPATTKRKPDEIFEGDLEINSVEIENGMVYVSCYQHDSELNYVGGTLKVSADEVLVRTEEGVEIGVDKLHEICNLYWNSLKS